MGTGWTVVVHRPRSGWSRSAAVVHHLTFRLGSRAAAVQCLMPVWSDRVETLRWESTIHASAMSCEVMSNLLLKAEFCSCSTAVWVATYLSRVCSMRVQAVKGLKDPYVEGVPE